MPGLVCLPSHCYYRKGMIKSYYYHHHHHLYTSYTLGRQSKPSLNDLVNVFKSNGDEIVDGGAASGSGAIAPCACTLIGHPPYGQAT